MFIGVVIDGTLHGGNILSASVVLGFVPGVFVGAINGKDWKMVATTLVVLAVGMFVGWAVGPPVGGPESMAIVMGGSLATILSPIVSLILKVLKVW